jgi:hypothetical protein
MKVRLHWRSALVHIAGIWNAYTFISEFAAGRYWFAALAASFFLILARI